MFVGQSKDSHNNGVVGRSSLVDKECPSYKKIVACEDVDDKVVVEEVKA